MTRIAVTGATGNVGGRVTRALSAAGHEVAAIARHAEASDFDDLVSVAVRTADLARPSTLEPAFAGAEALFLVVAGNDPKGVLDAAVAAGITRLVLVSSQGAGTRPLDYPAHRAFEDRVRESGLAWTILRPSGFQANALAWAESVRANRIVAAPFGDVSLPVIDPTDVAATAVVALLDESHAGHVYELTGPTAISPREQAQAIAGAIGVPVQFVELTIAEARAGMLPFMPEAIVEATLGILGSPTPRERRVTGDVAALLGRAPGSFADWARVNARAFGLPDTQAA